MSAPRSTTALRRRRLLVTVLFLFSVSAGVTGVWMLFENRALEVRRRARLAAMIPVPPGDPAAPDVVMAYEPPERGGGSLLEGYRVGERASRWHSGTREIAGLVREPARSVAVSGRYFALAGRQARPGQAPRAFVAVHRLRDGARAWEHLFPPGWDWALAFRIWPHGDLLLAGIAAPNTPRARLRALDMKSGHQRWEVEIAPGSGAPLFLGGHAVLPSGPHLLVIRLRDGSVRRAGGLVGFPFVVYGKLYAPLQSAPPGGGTVVEIGLGPGPLRFKGKIALPPGCRPRTGLAVYRRRLLCALGDRLKPEITALSLDDGHTLYRRPLLPGFGFRGLSSRWKRAAPAAASFHHLRTRYLPMILRKVGTASTARPPRRLVILDAETGQVTWASRPLGDRAGAFTGERILAGAHLHFLTLELPPPAHGHAALLVLDGRTGRFIAAKYVRVRVPGTERDWWGYPPTLRPWMLGPRRLFGALGPQAWAFELDKLTVRGIGRTTVRGEDARADVEATLGPLPR